MGEIPMLAVVRLLVFVFVGVIATLAWQSYGGATREAVASLSPRLAWLAPPAEPAGAISDRIAAISRDLAAARQSVDKVAAGLSKLETLQKGASDKTAASQPSPAAAPARKTGSGRER
jgi:hypothetical protein